MVRGHAKAVSQEKHAAKMADKAKSMKRDSAEVSGLQGSTGFYGDCHQYRASE